MIFLFHWLICRCHAKGKELLQSFLVCALVRLENEDGEGFLHFSLEMPKVYQHLGTWLRSWLGTEGCNIFIFHSLSNMVDLLRDSPVPKSNSSRSHPMVVSFGEDDHGNRTQPRAGDFLKFALNCWVFGTS